LKSGGQEIQTKDKMFQSHNHNCFRKPASRTPCGVRLIVGGSLVTDKTEVLAEWERYLRELSTSQSQAIPQNAEATKQLPEMEFLSRMSSDQVLDDEIVIEEIEAAIKRLKQGKRVTSLQNICCMEVSYSRCG